MSIPAKPSLTNVIDNQDSKLVDHIRDLLPHAKALHFAVGYFFLSGFEAIRDGIGDTTEMRLLIGNTTNRQTIDALASGHRRLEDAKQALRKQNFDDRRPTNREEVLGRASQNARDVMSHMDSDEKDAAMIKSLADLVASGRLRVRVYTQDGGVLHAKAYIFDYEGRYENGIAIVGSSNFSLGGLTHNSELNVVVHGNDYHQHLHTWYERLWDDAEDFEAVLLDELKRSWALNRVTPHEIYLKTLYHLVADRLDDVGGEDQLGKVWSGDLPPLTSFQEVAVKQALRIVEDYRGVIVGDVVGLGKSYVAMGLLSYYRRIRRQRALIVCPAPLVDMWETYNSVYDLGATVLSMSLLPNIGDELLDSDIYRNREIVLIDESHNFRNTNTQRYEALRGYMERLEPKAILLTATPQNNSVFDILHQIQLFHPSEQTDLPINPPELTRFVSLANKGERRIQDLLRPLFIRRTRRHVQTYYPEAVLPASGEKITFPERRLKTLEYNITAVYEGDYDQIADRLLSLNYAKYGLYDYVRPGERDKEPYRGLKGSGRSFRGIMRSMLFKRFESSVEAFRLTLKRMISLHNAFLMALQEGYIAVGDDIKTLLSEEEIYDEQQLVERLASLDQRYKIEDFDVERLERDIKQDLQAFVDLYSRVAAIGAEDDDKFQVLCDRLRELRAEGKKVIVFTQFSDTARYLYDNLHDDFSDLERVYSGQGNKLKIVNRFSPRANHHTLKNEETPIHLLISTDALSEGLNLQDAQALINYDLHWNPVRLIQRAGRIDRLGSQHEVVEFFNFLPQKEIETTLHLKERLSERIREIHKVIGEDAAILEPSEQVNEDAMYAIYSGDETALDMDEADQMSVGRTEAEEIIRALRDEDPALFERIKALPLGVRSAKVRAEGAGGDAYAFVFCQAGDYKKLYLVSETGEVLDDDEVVALAAIDAGVGEGGLEPPKGFNDLVAKVRRRFAAEVKQREAERNNLRKTPAQRYVLEGLELARSSLFEGRRDGSSGNLDDLYGLFSRHWGKDVERRLKTLRRDGVRGTDLVETLKQVASDFNLHNRMREADAEARVAHPVVVCAEYLGP